MTHRTIPNAHSSYDSVLLSYPEIIGDSCPVIPLIWTVAGGQTHSAVCVMCGWMDPRMCGSPEQNRTVVKVLDKRLVFLGPTLDHR